MKEKKVTAKMYKIGENGKFKPEQTKEKYLSETTREQILNDPPPDLKDAIKPAIDAAAEMERQQKALANLWTLPDTAADIKAFFEQVQATAAERARQQNELDKIPLFQEYKEDLEYWKAEYIRVHTELIKFKNDLNKLTAKVNNVQAPPPIMYCKALGNTQNDTKIKDVATKAEIIFNGALENLEKILNDPISGQIETKEGFLIKHIAYFIKYLQENKFITVGNPFQVLELNECILHNGKPIRAKQLNRGVQNLKKPTKKKEDKELNKLIVAFPLDS